MRLTGPGGLSALRGLLVTVLAATAGLDSGPVAVITAEDLRSLVGIDGDGVGVGGLHVIESSDAAPGVAAALATGGRRVLIVRSRAGHPGGWPDDVDRTGLTVISAGAEPSLPSWHVSTDGRVGRPAVRLAVLNAAAAAVVLAGLRRVAPQAVPPPDEAPPVTATEDPRQPVAAVAGAAPRRLRVTILGPVCVESINVDGARTPVPLRRSASLHVLLLLAVHRGGATSGDLAAALWPDEPAHLTARRLATSLWELRRSLQQATGADVVHRDPVLGGGSRHQLDPAHVEVDLWRLHDLLDAAGSAATQTERRTLLRQAADLEHGELAEGLTGEWLARPREATARHCIDVLTYLADAEPDHGIALTLLHRAARLAPDNEAVQRAVLRRHATAGDLDGVRRVYNALRDRCAARSDLPEPATVQLYEDLTDTAVTASTGAGAPERTPR
ncbi:AfsR/SARP family transcriptional regulator [Dactylosporangium cerinum]